MPLARVLPVCLIQPEANDFIECPPSLRLLPDTLELAQSLQALLFYE